MTGPGDVPTRIAQIVGEVVGAEPDEVGADRPLVDLGVDSLAMIEVVIGVEQTFGVTIADSDVAGLDTVAELTAYVDERLPKAESTG